ncbi:non-ribosomal peptide synthetase, partial [Cellvibrio mixtus]|uniref:non-ribosomal peptide synthetase n=1 Tax=Cellvibrio mixtus TaxID=39650 RepID=UPI000587791B
IYTSGSTGNPKGVMIEHKSLVNRIHWMDQNYGASPADRILQKTPFSFDVSVWEFMWPLSVGASLVLAKPEGHKDPHYLSEIIQTQKITKLHFVPSMLNSMLLHGDLSRCSSLKQVFCSGEALSPHQVRDFLLQSSAELHNLYGPTEAAIDVSYWACREFDKSPLLKTIPIGKPINNIQLYVLNQNLHLCPQGIAGELYIGGIGLARGYLNRSDLTAEKFIPNPFYDVDKPEVASNSRRLYKTGDVARWLPDGNIEFLGRADYQVKIRGFRIELGEIEAMLAMDSQVKDVIVVARESATGDKRLVAYIVPARPVEGVSANSSLIIESLRQQLKQSLPDYMLPSVFMLLDAFPLTPSGKADRKRLPEPDVNQQQALFVPPQTTTEVALCNICEDLLGIGRVGINDNFFQLGGHSLLVMQLIARAKAIGLPVLARDVFRLSSLGALAAVIEENNHVPPSCAVTPENLIEPGCARIKPEMLPLINLTQAEIEHIVATVPGGSSNIQDIYPLAPLQNGILFHHMLNDHNDPYILPALISVSGSDNLNNLLASLQHSMDRHDVLRTAILWQDLPMPIQVVYRKAELPITWLDLDCKKDLRSQMQSIMSANNHWMDLQKAPLLRLQIALDKHRDTYYVLLHLHHIASDRIGLNIIQQELISYCNGDRNSFSTPTHYREFVTHALQSSNTDASEVFFREMLSDVDEPTAPFNLLNVTGDGNNTDSAKGKIPEEIEQGIRSFSKQLHISAAAFFHAAWALVVAHCSGRDDVVFGTVLSGRLQGLADAEHQVGMFINTLPIRIQLDGLNARQLLEHSHHSIINLLPHEQCPLVSAQRCSRLSGGVPLFSAILNYRHSISIEGKVAGIELLDTQERTNYPFTLSVDDSGTGFNLDIQVDNSVSATRIINYMQAALAGLVAALNSGHGQLALTLPILPDVEQRQLLTEWNGPATDFKINKCIHELVFEQVVKQPHAIAVINEDVQFTYDEIYNRALILAHEIRASGAKPNELVAVMLERGWQQVVAVLGTMIAGAAYLPINIDLPEERKKQLLALGDVSILIAEKNNFTHSLTVRTLCIATDIAEKPDNLSTIQSLDDLAYVIFTSGSTGVPKGVAIEHRAVINTLLDMNNRFHIAADDRVFAISEINFDLSVYDIFGVLIAGGAIVVPSHALAREPSYWLAQIAMHGVTLWNSVPALMQMLIDYSEGDEEKERSLSTLRHVWMSGDWIPPVLPDRITAIIPSASIISLGGATEVSIWSIYFPIKNPTAHLRSIPYGNALTNQKFYVLNDSLQLCPILVAGDLYIGGIGLAREYWRNETITASSFIIHPETGCRLYRTGDRGRWLEEGTIEFLGRLDHQVKMRGFRIELGEIEGVLNSHEQVKDAVVLAKNIEGNESNKYLVAYVLANSNVLETDFTEQLRAYVNEKLPEYMLPSVFVVLDVFPLTSNGKVDRKALPEPDVTMLQAEFVAPQTEIEKILCEMWQDLLGRERIGIADNFFQLGGHSLSATRLMVKINEKFNLKLPLKAVFNTRNLADLAQLIMQLDKDESREPALVQVSRDQVLPLSFAQQRLWLLDRTEGSSAHYNISGTLRLTGVIKQEVVARAFATILDRHESLRTCFVTTDQGLPLQTIQAVRPLHVTVVDISFLTGEEGQQVLDSLIVKETTTTFDLSRDLMLRATLIKVAEEEHIAV